MIIYQSIYLPVCLPTCLSVSSGQQNLKHSAPNPITDVVINPWSASVVVTWAQPNGAQPARDGRRKTSTYSPLPVCRKYLWAIRE